MRKNNVFGKKLNTAKPLYYLIIIFLLSLAGYLFINYYSDLQLAQLKETQSQIQAAINQELLINQTSSYQEIEALTPYLPNDYSEAKVYNELSLVKDLSGMDNLSQYELTIKDGANNPFATNINSNLNYVKITVSMTLDDYSLVFDYLDNLASLNRIYYVDNLNISMFSDSSAVVSMEIYTFYMNS